MAEALQDYRVGAKHDVVCENGYVHWTCDCTGEHRTRTIVNCTHPEHQKEPRMTTEQQDELEHDVVTPEEAAATAKNGYEEHAGGYAIPSYDADEQPDDDPEPNAITAFLVVIDLEGQAFATGELSKLGEILPKREATLADLRNGAQQVVADASAMQVSQQTVMLMQQSALQAAEAQRAQKIANKLQERGIHLPTGGRR